MIMFWKEERKAPLMLQKETRAQLVKEIQLQKETEKKVENILWRKEDRVGS
jgi:hypothetical protein